MKFKDLTGQRFGKLVAVRRMAVNNRLAYHRGIMSTWTRHFTTLNVPWAITQAGKVQTLWKERRV